ncbi:LemA family protein [Fusobacterium perfoetens]|uniref:LemA family protein n=1 Tax=Fusobacterium perfoetens TaxID=852 RepID=UPI000487A105|nr:LemA family protein [Fusobacterium perfoetens]
MIKIYQLYTIDNLRIIIEIQKTDLYDTVTKYNENIKMFPGNIIANFFNFSEEKFFKADEKASNNINIDFYGGK